MVTYMTFDVESESVLENWNSKKKPYIAIQRKTEELVTILFQNLLLFFFLAEKCVLAKLYVHRLYYDMVWNVISFKLPHLYDGQF